MTARADLALGNIRLSEAYDGVPVSPIGTEYGPPAGAAPLRAAVADWLRVESDEVAITTGASLALAATMCTLPRPGSILIPRPHYPAYAQLARAFGLTAVTYELDRMRDWQVAVDTIEARVSPETRALILNLPSNPTGSLADEHALRRIHAIARAAQILTVCDETYGPLVFDGAARPDVSAIWDRANIVRIFSFSKLFGMPGERVGCAISAPGRVAAISRMHWILGMSPPATGQLVALTALRRDPDAHIATLVDTLTRNRDHALDMLAGWERVVTYTAPAGGCFLWLEIVDCGLSAQSFARRCAREGVKIMPGSAFGVEHPVYARASLGVPHDELTDGLHRICEVARHVRQRAESLVVPVERRS